MVVLAGMLGMPLLVHVAPTIAVPIPWRPQLEANIPSASSALENAQAPQSSLPTPPTGASDLTRSAPDSHATSSARTIPTMPSPTSHITEPESRISTNQISATALWWGALLAIYLLGVTVFGVRLLAALLCARRLICRANPVTLPSTHAELVGQTLVLETAQVRVPVTVGLQRACILLPVEWKSWSDALLASVLAHEQAHVRRRDHWVVLVSELNRIIYWFHPLAWFLRARLAALAEEACDDAVIESLGDRTGYARHLLKVAGRLTGQQRRLQPIGVAMARVSQVEHRINAILDTRRPLARRIGWTGAILLACIMLPAVIFTAGVSADDRETVTPDPPQKSLQVTILNENDEPVAGAEVALRIRQEFAGSWDVTRKQGDQAGQAIFELPGIAPHYLSVRVSSPGFVPFLAEWEESDATVDPIPDSYAIRLESGTLIGGVVQDEAGRPIEGATVMPHFDIRQRPKRTSPLGAGASIKTDASGRWSYSSFPRDVHQLSVRVQHPNYQTTRVEEPVSRFVIPSNGVPGGTLTMKQGVVIRGRVTDGNDQPASGAVIRYFQHAFSSDMPRVETDAEGYYQFDNGERGKTFLTVSAKGWAPAVASTEITPEMAPIDFALTKGKPLRVKVVDPEGNPLTQASISLWTWNGVRIYGGLSEGRGQTDEHGAWEWPHAPEGSLHFAIANPGFAYISEEPLTPGEQENVVTMVPESPERSGVVSVSGKVVDAETREPIPRFYVTTGHQRQAGGASYWNYDTRSEWRDGAFRRELKARDFASPVYARVLQIEAVGYLPTSSPAITERDGYVTIDFELVPGSGQDFVLLTPDGAPASGATIAVSTPRLGPTISNGTVIPNSTATRVAADRDGRFALPPQTEPFAIIAVHDSGAAYVTEEELASSRTISLEPWARVEGVLKIRGEPAAGEMIDVRRADRGLQDQPKFQYQNNTTTDESGKFALDQILPGHVQVARRVISEHDNGRFLIPTHVATAEVLTGETTFVDLSRDGLPVVARLSVPQVLEDKNDWRLAMASLRATPTSGVDPPQIPFPEDIDPEVDQDAAMQWWEEWKSTEEGLRFQAKMKLYQEAIRNIATDSFSAPVQPNGEIRFEDIPPGTYQFSVQALAPSADGLPGPDIVIAALSHKFTIEEMPDEGRSEPFDLGELMLDSL